MSQKERQKCFARGDVTSGVGSLNLASGGVAVQIFSAAVVVPGSPCTEAVTGIYLPNALDVVSNVAVPQCATVDPTVVVWTGRTAPVAVINLKQAVVPASIAVWSS